MKKRPRDIPLMNINPEGLRVSMKNGEMVIGPRARARAISHGNLPENRPIWPEITFFQKNCSFGPKIHLYCKNHLFSSNT